MFDLDAGKLLVFGIVALAVIPAKDLPRVLRTVGKYVGQMRRMASDFQGQFMDAIKEAELDSVKKELAAMTEASKLDVSFDPAGMMRDSVQKSIDGPAKVTETLPEGSGAASHDVSATPPEALPIVRPATDYENVVVSAPAMQPPHPEPEKAPLELQPDMSSRPT